MRMYCSGRSAAEDVPHTALACRSSHGTLQPFGRRRRQVRYNPSVAGHDGLPRGQQLHRLVCAGRSAVEGVTTSSAIISVCVGVIVLRRDHARPPPEFHAPRADAAWVSGLGRWGKRVSGPPHNNTNSHRHRNPHHRRRRHCTPGRCHIARDQSTPEGIDERAERSHDYKATSKTPSLK